MSKIIAIYPGTFDPITHGHMDIIKRAAKIFETIIVGVAEDTTKSTLFSLDERAQMIINDIKAYGLNDKNISVVSFSGLLIDFATKHKASVILRGLRAASDFEYEFQMAFMNYKLSPSIETLFLPASENGHFISSRFVKELARLKGNIAGFVSPNVAAKLHEYYNNV